MPAAEAARCVPAVGSARDSPQLSDGYPSRCLLTSLSAVTDIPQTSSPLAAPTLRPWGDSVGAAKGEKEGRREALAARLEGFPRR